MCPLIKELCTNEENDKTGCNFNFGHECIIYNVSKFGRGYLIEKYWKKKRGWFQNRFCDTWLKCKVRNEYLKS